MARGPVTLRTGGARLVGAEEIERRLARLAEGVRFEILRDGLAAGAEIIRNSAARRVADQPELAAALATKVTTTSAGRAVALIGLEKVKTRSGFSVIPLGYWREFGTKAHEIVASKFKRGRRRRKGTPTGETKRVLASPTAIFGPRVAHPGLRPRPFLGPAFEEDGSHALHVMGQTIWERLRGMAT